MAILNLPGHQQQGWMCVEESCCSGLQAEKLGSLIVRCREAFRKARVMVAERLLALASHGAEDKLPTVWKAS